MSVKSEGTERIAKFLSRAGVASRRDAERLVEEGCVKVNGQIIDTPAFFVSDKDTIYVNGHHIDFKESTKVWAFYKPRGCITADYDPEGRQTVYDLLPDGLPRLMSIGRLDYNSEGLLLFTNDGALKRHMELPKTALQRRYRVRAFGNVTQDRLDILAQGLVIDRVHYAPVYAELEKIQGGNAWVLFTLIEGKNREIRKLMDYLGYEVNRLIRVDYGPFSLGKMKLHEIKEVPSDYLAKIFPKIGFAS